MTPVVLILNFSEREIHKELLKEGVVVQPLCSFSTSQVDSSLRLSSTKVSGKYQVFIINDE